MSEQTITTSDVEDYVPGDRTGYTLTAYNEDRTDAETYYVVTRDADGVGLGAYHTDQQIDGIIAEDRAYLASIEPDTATADVAATAAAADAAGVDSSGQPTRTHQAPGQTPASAAELPHYE